MIIMENCLYEGDTEDDLPHGFGKLIDFAGNVKYEGGFHKGLR